MASTKKKNKLKNAYLARNILKNKKGRLKRMLFYTPSQRRTLKIGQNKIYEGERL